MFTIHASGPDINGGILATFNDPDRLNREMEIVLHDLMDRGYIILSNTGNEYTFGKWKDGEKITLGHVGWGIILPA